MTLNDLELSGFIRQIKNSITGEGDKRINMDELIGMGKDRELMSRFKTIEIAAQLAQERLGKIT